MTDEVEQTGGQEEAPIVAVEEAAVKAAEVAKAADEAKAKEAAEAEAKAKEEEKPKQPEKDWRDKELAKKHAQIKEKERLLAEKEQQIKDLEAIAARIRKEEGEAAAQRGELPPVSPAAPPSRFESDVKAEAERIVKEREFQANLAAMEAKGRETYKEGFEKSIENLRLLGGFDPETLNKILATDDPSKVLHDLGTNPNEYHRIMELAPDKRGVELTKMAMTAAPKPRLSEAPAPVETVGGRGGSNANEELRDDLSDEEWNRIRDKQERARWAAKNGRAA